MIYEWALFECVACVVWICCMFSGGFRLLCCEFSIVVCFNWLFCCALLPMLLLFDYFYFGLGFLDYF